jgi:fibro-slime domain-containing protein
LAGSSACVSSAETFSQWYGAGAGDYATIVGNIMLYPNGQNGYVNRFGPNGEPYTTAVDNGSEQGGYGTDAASCAATCTQRTGDSLQCVNVCRPDHDQVDQRIRTLEQAETSQTPDLELIAELELEIEELEAAAAQCDADCAVDFTTREEACIAQCAPCSFSADQWCIGGELIELDGNPLFFPIDNHPDAITPVAEYGAARVPAQIYQGLGWPWEGACADGDDWQTCAGPKHNFHFTSEIAYWFEYEEGVTSADLTFIGDDDVWVFVNGRLALDLGGIHVPLAGQFTLTANGNVTLTTWEPPDPGEGETMDTRISNTNTTAMALGLEDGGVYEIKVFHAERKPEGSSYQLTLSGFNTARSECVAICGDGILAAGEQCDEGTAGNLGGHNGCNSNCTLGSYCGDGIVQEEEGEACDDRDPNKPADCAGCRRVVIK